MYQFTTPEAVAKFRGRFLKKTAQYLRFCVFGICVPFSNRVVKSNETGVMRNEQLNGKSRFLHQNNVHDYLVFKMEFYCKQTPFSLYELNFPVSSKNVQRPKKR